MPQPQQTTTASTGEVKPRGHLFVVQGRIGEVGADACVISTDRAFSVRDYWRSAIVGSARRFSAASHRPTDWTQIGWGRSRKPESSAVWFLDVYTHNADIGDQYSRLIALLSAIASEQQPTSIEGRLFPLIAIPVIGTKGGGQGHVRGQVLDRLLATCADFVADHAVDVAIVTPNQTLYAAIQHQRVQLLTRYFPDRDTSKAKTLGDAAADGSLALFIGAGTSLPAGLPSWKDLIKKLAVEAKLSPEVQSDFEHLNGLDQAELLDVLLAKRLGTSVAKIINSAKATRPALAHALLAGLGCQAAVTTNYDSLYERAAAYSHSDQVTAILPSETPSGNQRWLLKMHGTADKPESIILTRGQFAGYDSSHAPSGAVLQSLLLTKHVLAVGTSMTDDNVLRLIHEVNEYRRQSLGDRGTDAPKLGTILDVGGNEARGLLHGKSFDWVTMAGANDRERARQLEIFLDCVSAFACRDRSWMLDTRFAHLLSPDEMRWSKTLNDLASELQSSAPLSLAWRDVALRLDEMGARPHLTAESADKASPLLQPDRQRPAGRGPGSSSGRLP